MKVYQKVLKNLSLKSLQKMQKIQFVNILIDLTKSIYKFIQPVYWSLQADRIAIIEFKKNINLSIKNFKSSKLLHLLCKLRDQS